MNKKYTGSAFASGGGAMGARLRAFDWATTPLGPLAGWSSALRVSVDMVLASDFPACLFWGPDLIAIYNDGYMPLLGNKREALGEPMRTTWSEGWEQLRPIAQRALAGDSTFIEDYLLRDDRNGVLEDAYFTFCYSPVFDDHGHAVGLLDTVIETTAKVLAERAAAAERERLKAMLQQMPGFVALLSGPEHVYTYVNDAYVEIGGARDFIGRPVREVFPELAGQGFFELLDGVYASGESYNAQAVPLRLAGEPEQRFIDLLFQATRDAQGAVNGIFVGGYDVTLRSRAETRLRRLNAQLEQEVTARTLARGRTWQLSPELLGVVDADGHFEASNPAWQALLGWSEQELATTVFLDFVHPDDLERTKSVWADAVQRGLPSLRFENRYRVKGGDWRWLSWVAVPEDGKIYCSARDVQSDKEREAVLAERTAERDVLARIVQTTGSQIQVLDLQYRFLAINPAAIDEYERLFGVRPALGDCLLDLLARLPHAADRDAATALWRRAMAGEAFTVQHEFGDPARGRRHFEIKFEVLWGADGEQRGAFTTAADISQRVQEQASLLETQEALRQAQKMEAVGQLTGGLAHDFNNLLAAISGSLQVIKAKLARDQFDGLDRYVNMGEGAVRRAAGLTQRLLAFSRRQTLDPRALDVNRLVGGMEELIRRTVGPSVQVEVVGAGGLWTTRADASQLENSLLNLCINARDAMLPLGGRLTIETANKWFDGPAATERELPPGQYISLCVTDTGAGMPPDVAQRIFDPFYTTKPIGQGTGLGLSMVYGFVRQSGGQVRVYTELGHGTTMCLYLPRHIGSEAVEPPSEPPTTGFGDSDGEGETVLVVEDEDSIRALIAEMLEQTGYRVLLAADGPAALRALQAARRIDLLLTDVGLPGGLNGRQVADAARAMRPDLKVLFLTGFAENAAVGNGLMEVGMQVMTKPFDVAGLVSKVHEMLKRSGRGAGA